MTRVLAFQDGTSRRRGGTRRIRVAHVIYTHGIGGSEMCASEICRHLDPSAYETTVISLQGRDGPLLALLRKHGVAAFSLRWSRYWRLLGPFYLALKLRGLGIDILHVHHVSLLRTIYRPARLAGVPRVLVTEHAKYSISRSKVLQDTCRDLIPRVDACTVISENLKGFFARELGIPEDLMTILPNGVDTRAFRPRTDRSRLERVLPEGFRGTVLLAVGRLAEAKDYPTLLSAMVMLRERNCDVFLVIVGGGPLRGALEEEIRRRRLESHVHLAGERSDVPGLLASADAFVLSSKREGLPMAVLEAMSSGLPLVSTAVGGIPEVVSDGRSGILVPPEDPEALAEALYEISSNEDRRLELGKAARQRILDRYDIREIAERYAAIYSELLPEAQDDR